MPRGDHKPLLTPGLYDGSGARSVEHDGQLSGQQCGVVRATAFGLLLEERGQIVLMAAGDLTRWVLGRLQFNRGSSPDL